MPGKRNGLFFNYEESNTNCSMRNNSEAKECCSHGKVMICQTYSNGKQTNFSISYIFDTHLLVDEPFVSVALTS